MPQIDTEGVESSKSYQFLSFFMPLMHNFREISSVRGSIKEAYKLHEAQKRLKYEQRIVEVENSSFNPLVFATIGGAAPTASGNEQACIQSDQKE